MATTVYKLDLKQRTFTFSLDLITFIDTLPREKSCWIIADQLLRSGTSVGANLTEATASSSRLEFKKFHEIALKSANESKYWLELLDKSGKANSAACKKLLSEVIEISSMIAADVKKLKQKSTY